MPLRAALYVRVSTDKQTTANQLPELRELAARRGFVVVAEFTETESAKKARPVFDEAMTFARSRRCDVLLVWALDRLHRSMAGTLADVLDLDRLGVRVVSVRESWLDTDGPARSLLLAIFGWVAEQERNRLVERTNAGLRRARAAGKKLGRPRADSAAIARGVDLLQRGTSERDAARICGVSASTLRRAKKGAGVSPPAPS